MWVIDLIIQCQKAKQRKERERWWRLDIGKLLARKNERKTKQRAENVRKKQ